MTSPRYEYGSEVRLIRNVRNDGTYPGMEVGDLLIRRGEVGAVYDVGTYLQDQIIYRVHFIGAGRTVGCREEELIPASDPWIPNLFEFREYVVTTRTLTSGGQTVVQAGQVGSVMKVLREDDKPIHYHVHFGGGRLFLIPESILQKAEKPTAGNEDMAMELEVDDDES